MQLLIMKMINMKKKLEHKIKIVTLKIFKENEKYLYKKKNKTLVYMYYIELLFKNKRNNIKN